MKCKKCGTRIRKGDDFCIGCGEKVIRKKNNIAKAIIILAIIGIFAGGAWLVYSFFFGYRSVKVEEFDGYVELERDEKEKDIFEGEKLIPEDKVTTGPDGLMELLIDSDKHLVAEKNSCFVINAVGNENSGKVRIDLKYGAALATLDEKLNEDSEFEIKTPNSLCSVRGTTFKVEYDKVQAVTRVEVTKGVVRVKAGNDTVDLNAGESAIIRNDKITRTVIIGKYEQDGNTANGPEPVEWEVLKDLGSESILISHDILDVQQYNNDNAAVTWEDSSLRQWLNEDFYDNAFTDEEKALISNVNVQGSDNGRYGTVGGKSTRDKVYIPAVEELTSYYGGESDPKGMTAYVSPDMRAYMTRYAEQKTAANGEGEDAFSSWWLRTPGADGTEACFVLNNDVSYDNLKHSVTAYCGVRPVIRLKKQAAGVSAPDPAAVQTTAAALPTAVPESAEEQEEVPEPVEEPQVREPWRDAYLQAINNGEFIAFKKAALVFVDSDDVPEIAVHEDEATVVAGGAGDMIYSYQSGKVISSWISLDGIKCDECSGYVSLLSAWGDPWVIMELTPSGFKEISGGKEANTRVKYDMTKDELIEFLKGTESAGGGRAGNGAKAATPTPAPDTRDPLYPVGYWSDEGDNTHYNIKADGTAVFTSRGAKGYGSLTWSYDGETLYLTDSNGKTSAVKIVNDSFEKGWVYTRR